MSGLFADNPYYSEYEMRLKQLHALIAEGKGETDEAETIRDAMDTPWLHLTEEERNRLNGLSADLYMLQDDEVFEPTDGRTKIQIGQAIYAALGQSKWEVALALMRKPNWIPRDRIAAMRARIYETLGHADVSLLFARHASKLKPENPTYKALLLNRLAQSGYFDEATNLSRVYLGDASLSLFPRVVAADILLQVKAQKLDDSDSTLYERLIDLLQTSQEIAPHATTSLTVRSAAHEVIGFCYYMRGQLSEAIESFNQAMRMNPHETLRNIIEHLTQQRSGVGMKNEDFQHLALSDLARMRSIAVADMSFDRAA